MQVDSNTGRLSAYERYSSGGLHYQKTIYQFIKGKLTVVEREIQEPAPDNMLSDATDTYIKSVYQLKYGSVAIVNNEIITIQTSGPGALKKSVYQLKNGIRILVRTEIVSIGD